MEGRRTLDSKTKGSLFPFSPELFRVNYKKLFQQRPPGSLQPRLSVSGYGSRPLLVERYLRSRVSRKPFSRVQRTCPRVAHVGVASAKSNFGETRSKCEITCSKLDGRTAWLLWRPEGAE